jgi:hypothetical protein
MTMLDDRSTTTDEPELDEDGFARPPAAGEAETPFGRWQRNLPLLVMVGLAVMVAAAAFVVWNQNRDLRSASDDRRDAATVASDFTTAVLSYDHRHLQGSVDNVLGLSTPDWGRQYEDAWFQEQQPIVEATRARAEVAVDDVMLGDEADGVVHAVVAFNATIHSQVCVRHLQGSFLALDLVQDEGRWKVDDMRYLGQQNQSCDTAGANGGGNGNGAPAAGG